MLTVVGLGDRYGVATCTIAELASESELTAGAVRRALGGLEALPPGSAVRLTSTSRGRLGRRYRCHVVGRLGVWGAP